MPTIPQHDSNLRLDDSTTVEDVLAFVEARVQEPARIGGVTVWNFNSHDLEPRPLLEIAEMLQPGDYVVPYQVPGVWGFIVWVVPQRIQYAPLLTYRKSSSEYAVYENYLDSFGDLEFETVDERMRHLHEAVAEVGADG